MNLNSQGLTDVFNSAREAGRMEGRDRGRGEMEGGRGRMGEGRDGKKINLAWKLGYVISIFLSHNCNTM